MIVLTLICGTFLDYNSVSGDIANLQYSNVVDPGYFIE